MSGTCYITYWKHLFIGTTSHTQTIWTTLAILLRKNRRQKYEAIGSDQINQTQKEEKTASHLASAISWSATTDKSDSAEVRRH